MEFQESGEFSSKVFNLNNQYWYADASELHCVIRETASDNTMLELIFHGKNVKNYGEADQSIDTEKEIKEQSPHGCFIIQTIQSTGRMITFIPAPTGLC